MQRPVHNSHFPKQDNATKGEEKVTNRVVTPVSTRIPGPKKWLEFSGDETSKDRHLKVADNPKLKAKIWTDSSSGDVTLIIGGISVPEGKSNREIVETFLRTQHSMLKIHPDLSDIEFFKAGEEGRGVYFVAYRQVYQGLPVFGKELKITTNGKDKIYTVSVGLTPVTHPVELQFKPDTERAIGSALNAVARDLEIEPSQLKLGKEPQAELGVVIRDGTPRVMWRITFPILEPRASLVVMVEGVSYETESIRNYLRR
jgi:Zn-dependent metalloprotease